MWWNVVGFASAVLWTNHMCGLNVLGVPLFHFHMNVYSTMKMSVANHMN